MAETAECLRRLNTLPLEAQETVPADEYNQLRRGIGKVLGYMYTDKAEPAATGRPGYHPKLILELYMKQAINLVGTRKIMEAIGP